MPNPKTSRAPLFVRLDHSRARRSLLCGDIHGRMDAFEAALERVGYDPEAGDALTLLGDLFDRGPDVERLVEWLDAHPGVTTLRGNHDDMLASTTGAKAFDFVSNPVTLMKHGGAWITRFAPNHEDDDRGRRKLVMDLIGARSGCEVAVGEILDPYLIELGRRLADHPVVAEIATPGGLTIGAVHADPPAGSWKEIERLLTEGEDLERGGAEFHCMWSRRLFEEAGRIAEGEDGVLQDAEALRDAGFVVTDIDHVFMGHTIVDEPLTISNLTWLDTGSYRTGLVTILDADAWLASNAAKRS
jgi:serine/threonine protein phosphatase 1